MKNKKLYIKFRNYEKKIIILLLKVLLRVGAFFFYPHIIYDAMVFFFCFVLFK